MLDLRTNNLGFICFNENLRNVDAYIFSIIFISSVNKTVNIIICFLFHFCTTSFLRL
jgi:NADH:ubiquinone oxidoreductase subunit K